MKLLLVAMFAFALPMPAAILLSASADCFLRQIDGSPNQVRNLGTTSASCTLSQSGLGFSNGNSHAFVSGVAALSLDGYFLEGLWRGEARSWPGGDYACGGMGICYAESAAESRISMLVEIAGEPRPGYLSVTVSGGYRVRGPAGLFYWFDHNGKNVLNPSDGNNRFPSFLVPVTIGGVSVIDARYAAIYFDYAQASCNGPCQAPFTLSFREADGITPVQMMDVVLPEPSSWALTGLSLTALLMVPKWRRHKHL